MTRPGFRGVKKERRGDREGKSPEWAAYERDVVAGASNRWPEIMRGLAPSLSDAIDMRGRRGVPCPVHGGKDGLRVFKNFPETGGLVCNTCGSRAGGISALMWANTWRYGEALREVGRFIGMDWDLARKGEQRIQPRTPAPPPAKPKDPKTSFDQRLKNSKRIMSAYADSVPVDWSVDNNPVVLYLKNRGHWDIQNDPPHDLRFHPGLDYWQSEAVLGADGRPLKDARSGLPKERMVKVGTFPVMLATIRAPDGKVINFHRTFITAEGRKAPVAQAKKPFTLVDGHTLTGSAVRLYPAGRILGVAEGIETALGARSLMRLRQNGRLLPVWAGRDAGCLSSMVVEDHVDELLVFADRDQNIRNKAFGRGEEAALLLRARYEDRVVRIFLPEQVDVDWEDVRNGFRKSQSRREERFIEPLGLPPSNRPALAVQPQAQPAAESPGPSSEQPQPTAEAPLDGARLPVADERAGAPDHDRDVGPESVLPEDHVSASEPAPAPEGAPEEYLDAGIAGGGFEEFTDALEPIAAASSPAAPASTPAAAPRLEATADETHDAAASHPPVPAVADETHGAVASHPSSPVPAIAPEPLPQRRTPDWVGLRRRAAPPVLPPALPPIAVPGHAAGRGREPQAARGPVPPPGHADSEWDPGATGSPAELPLSVLGIP